MTPDTPHSVRDTAGRRWPVIDGITFARASRLDLAGEALSRLDAGDQEGALVLLLADQDDWWRGATAEASDLRILARDRARLTLRQAVTCLAWDAVGDYFLHRWSDPTFVAGLALMEAHWNEPRTAFELACGIGHFLRVLAQRGVGCTGADVVFAKLWVARHWVAPDARLVCFDAGLSPWPMVSGERFDLVCCHDAFYFLRPQDAIAAQLAALAGDAGSLTIGHVHNRDRSNLSAGWGLAADEVARLFPGARLYDDAELTQATIGRRVPSAAQACSLRDAEAFGIATGPGIGPARPVAGKLSLPPHGTALRRNPLLRDGTITWPSDRYAEEYGPRATYSPASDAPERTLASDETVGWVLRRELLDLPDRW
ncbi:bifunctional 2-polyprenyl-6-hydroxyphenol methylase/3-demethylubiquinol 3-O-methyltransferase UbiG [Roseicella sp. DB1501]|uniref:class I SAM-dependent methyltransferase n=1 Tax=Roseicella sp. DB1501 TaxID=2730925 RepID=UPI00149141B7|nr:class I SAM-dependent methyltransferase [Roseicella sp. DB1501]NOG72236.1 methyltransferase domain-containing protein [Roseicella sp. DB1501]